MNWPLGDGDMAKRMRAHDWAATPLGPADAWPERVKAVIELVLASPLVSSVALGTDRRLIYNDAAARLYGERHPGALGRPLADIFPDSYPQVAALYDRVFAGETVQVAAQPLAVGAEGGGEVFDAYLTPVRNAAGAVIGAHMIGLELSAEQRVIAALRESAEQLRYTIEANPYATWTATPTGEWDFSSDRWKLWTGSNGLGAEWYGVQHPDDLPDMLGQWMHGVHNGTPVDIEHRVQMVADGSYRWMRSRAFPRFDAAGAVVKWYGMTEDIDDRKRIADAMRDSEARLALAVDIGGIGHWQLDLTTLELSTSVHCRRNFGRPEERAFSYDDLIASIHPDDRERQQSVVAAAIEARSSFHIEYRLSTSQGMSRWAQVQGRYENGDKPRLVGVSRDITEQKRAEEALRESEEQHRLMLELVPVLLWRADPAGYAILTDGSWQKFTGQSDDEVQDFGWLDAIHPDDLPTTRAAFAHAFATGEPLVLEHRIRGPEGYRWHIVRHVPVRDAQGVITHWFGAAIDAHARHELQAGQRFLLKLGDTLRPLRDAMDIQQAAIAMLGEHLGVNRAGYYEVGPDEDEFFLTARWEQGAPPLPDRMLITDFGDEIREGYLAGRTMVMRDTEQEAVTDDNLATVRALQIRAWIGVPLVKEGRWVAAVGAHSVTPRDWTPAEIALVEEVGERTWAAIERARAEAALQASEGRLQLLVAELQHRARNILTVIRSVFSRTVERGGPVEEIADHFSGRLASLARTQVVMTQTASGEVDLQNLIRDELLSVGAADNPNVTITGPDVALPPKTAESIGLAIHELTTNAIKYGALRQNEGKLRIEWTTNIVYGEAPRLLLTWTEQGVPAISVKPTRYGFGSELIEEALPYRLGAETKLEFRGGGVCCTISVPLPTSNGEALPAETVSRNHVHRLERETHLGDRG